MLGNVGICRGILGLGKVPPNNGEPNGKENEVEAWNIVVYSN